MRSTSVESTTIENRHSVNHRRGAVLLLIALLLPVLLAMVAFAIDLGAVYLVRTELQRNADAAALAGVSALRPSAKPHFPLKSPLALNLGVPDVLAVKLGHDLETSARLSDTELSVIKPQQKEPLEGAYEMAQLYAGLNPVMGVSQFQQRRDDISVFYQKSHIDAPPLLPLPGILGSVTGIVENLLLVPPDYSDLNAVRVTARRDTTINEPMTLFFGPALGHKFASVKATATAVRFKGYGVRPGARVLPFAMDITVWRALRLGNGVVNGVPLAQQILGPDGRPVILIDEQVWNEDNNQISRGSDNIWEVIVLNKPAERLEPVVEKINPLKKLLGGLTGQSDPLSDALDSLLKTPATVVTLNLSGGSGQPDVPDIRRQLLEGVNKDDIGERLYLPFTRYGDESIPLDVFDDLRSIVGEPRIMPLFETLSGTVGNKVKGLLQMDEPYRIVGFGGVVITEVRDLGIAHYVKFQPAPMMSQFVLKACPDQPDSYSDCVYTCPLLVH
ncbi:pilus assembly protein TadG-related protein [Rubinisphaera margarita]|uniref:pilus assembly protein TadG-related protein n=1 Tax=Rubinisphaera margarita TaxID=2909586 RepID=UPI001EE8D581|nr:pilus assembly protein TadG-related protein [Rubinisphaera margarita]MCG6157477.1 Tad domain-containing protein [Rubinisphaera margarita]